MKTEQIKTGAQVRISSQQLRARVWILVGAELSERGLTLTLEREENGETILREEWATDCEAA